MPDNEIKEESPGVEESPQVMMADNTAEASSETAENDSGKPDDYQQISEPAMENVENLEQAEETTEQQGLDTKAEKSAEEKVNMVSPVEFEQFPKSKTASSPQNIDILMDVTMPISIELGRTTMPIQDILNLGPGSVVELNKLAGEPVDLLVNEKLIAKGEVVVVDENFGIRITTMVSQEERIKSLG